ncbi:MAG: hypothetical protein L0Y79_09250, partial [Chlorobi bacterium]|nr:hypothetical protein [Chlorobiota bacterium]
MKKIFFTVLFTLILIPLTSYSQRIIFESDFENFVPPNNDSIPQNWLKIDVDGNNPLIKWAVRDTSVDFGGNTRVRAIGTKSLEIPWYAGNGGNFINDDWVFTQTFTAAVGDSVIWWMLIGSDSLFSPYLDSMQVYVCFDQDPGAVITKLATIKSNDSAGVPLNNNVWTQHKFV